MTIFNINNLGDEEFTSGWSYLTDDLDQPCQGEVEIFDKKIICETKVDSVALNLLFDVPSFGKVVLRTNVVKKDSENDLLEALILGRIDQINHFLKQNDLADLVQFSEKLKNISKEDNSIEKLSQLLFLGEELAMSVAENRLNKRINNGETKDFLIGGQAFGINKDPKYKQIHKDTFNLGIAPLYFFLVKDKSQKEFNWELTDGIVDWLIETKRPIKGHPLVWMHKYARPDWMLGLNFEELKLFLVSHIKQVFERYGDKIKMWDIVNEIPAIDANGFDLTMDQLMEITKMVSELVKELQPDAERIINFSEIFGAKSFIQDKPSIPPIYFLKLCEKYGIEYESIGLQFYMGMKKEFTCRELLNIMQTVDQFSQFGKNIHFSELGWPSKHDVDPNCFFSADHPEVAGRWHRGWDEDLQAEFAEKIYTIFSSVPKSKSITWWDITDQGIHEDIGSRFIPFAGLTRRDYSPKPILKTIKEFKEKINS